AWDARASNGVLLQAFFPAEADGAWSQATDNVKATIKGYSEKWFSYPYPTATVIAGPIGGMEYPMVAFVPASYAGASVAANIDHELGHQWFPMIVGSNETRFAWMDEGFDTFINTAARRLYKP